MRRPTKSKRRYTNISDIKAEISVEVLAGIGAVALAWNSLESSIDYLLCHVTDIPRPLELEFTSRINGFDGKIAIIKAGLRNHAQIPEGIADLMAASFGAAEEYKRYRDGVEHALILERDSDIAQTAQRRGRLDEIIVSKEALDTLYEHIVAIDRELFIMMKMLLVRAMFFAGAKKFKIDPIPKEMIEQNVEDFLSYALQLRDLQTTRKALRKLPQFPEEPPILPMKGEPPKLLG